MQVPRHGVPHLGLSVAPAAAVDGAGGKGVVVTAVDPNGPAADAGFKVGTVILDVGGKAVGNSRDVVKALQEAQAQGKHDVLMRVQVDGATHFVALPLRAA
jgi:serine protease Do